MFHSRFLHYTDNYAIIIWQYIITVQLTHEMSKNIPLNSS